MFGKKKKNGEESKKRNHRETAEEKIISTIYGNTTPNQLKVNAEWVALASSVHDVNMVKEVVEKYGSKITNGEIDLTLLKRNRDKMLRNEEEMKILAEQARKSLLKGTTEKQPKSVVVPKVKPATRAKAAQKPANKPTKPKPAAPKEAPSAKKPAEIKKTAAKKIGTDKLKHSDKDEMKVTGEKPIVINAANAKPKRAPKVLRRVARSGGYTAWDDIKRSGKTFATEQEAKDYAADVLKKTGKIVPVTPTDRQVTHTFKAEQTNKK